MTKTLLVLSLGLTFAALAGASAHAQSMNLQEFTTRANRLPRNPTIFFHRDYRPLRRELEGGLTAVYAEQEAARTAGRAPTTCLPDQITFNPDQMLRELNTIPAVRRGRMTITDGVRELMGRRHPCSRR